MPMRTTQSAMTNPIHPVGAHFTRVASALRSHNAIRNAVTSLWPFVT